MAEEEKKESERREKDEETPAAKPAVVSSKIVRYLVGAIIFLVIISITVAVAWWVSDFVLKTRRPQQPDDQEQAGEIKAEQPVKTFDCGDAFTVILTDPEGRSGVSFTLRLEIRLLVNPDAHDPEPDLILAELGRRKEMIRNAIYDVLLGLDPQRFQGREAAKGWSDLKGEIQKAVSLQLPIGYGAQIQTVLFDNPIFQGG